MFNIKLFVQHYIKKMLKGTPDDVLILFLLFLLMYFDTRKMFINLLVIFNCLLAIFCVEKNINSQFEYKVIPKQATREYEQMYVCCVLEK